MRVASLQSGSNGNCYYVAAGGVRLLIDAGISGKQARLRLADLGADPTDAHALLLTHDHRDHAGCAGIYHRMFGLDIHATAGTMQRARERIALGRTADPRLFRSGGAMQFGDLRVEAIRTPHDGAEPVSFVFDDGRRRLGILTDLGHVFDTLGETIASLDAVIIESNYDEHMLETGPYPAFLKHRIRGDGGHISNRQSAELVRQAGHKLQWVCLGHLSEDNNTPDLAVATFRDIVSRRLPVRVAGRYRPTDLMEV